ncbi:MAG: hypothetical protein M1829_005322 [Trizodia sp. TS-e1964]|nr:MAG: hypothetical protein M1829_005322 [Trizodia sp. TS-e1964]
MESSLVYRAEMAGRNSTGALPTTSSMVSYTYGLTGVDLGMDLNLTHVIWISLCSLILLVLTVRLFQMGNAHLRHLFTMTADHDQQLFWAVNQGFCWPWLKKNLLYAPLWKKRHNREIKLSTALNFGTLPSRFHTLLLVFLFSTNVAYALILDYRNKDKSALIAEFRGRTGVLAVVNMIPLVVLAGRNNPLIALLRVSFDTYNLLHRWIGRLIVLEAVAHTCAWTTNTVMISGWSTIGVRLTGNKFYMYGAVGVCSMLFILIQSPSPVRHAFYEIFLHLHIFAAFSAMFGVYFHLDTDKLPQTPYIKIVIALWAAERLFRILRLLYRNFSRNGCTTVTVTALPGEACRLTFNLARPWKFTPGCHVYVYLWRISGYQSHPFSVAWSEDTSSRALDHPRKSALNVDEEKQALEPFDFDAKVANKTSLSIVVSKKTGMTAKLYDLASNAPQHTLVLNAAIEGPYGGHESLHSYGTVVMFAGGVGITHQLSHVRDLVAGYGNGTVAARKIVLVWIVRSTEHLEWVRPWMDNVLQMPGRREVLKVMLFVTKPRSQREIVSPSRTVQMFPGRPNPQTILDKEILERTGAMCVTVCGSGSLADNVRHATRRRVNVANLDFIEESFTW